MAWRISCSAASLTWRGGERWEISMGGIIVSEFVSIDGFYADPGGGLDWVTADDEHHDYSISLLERTGLLLFGRRTYEIFEAYWPRVADNPAATRRELAIGGLLDPIPKVVYPVPGPTPAGSPACGPSSRRPNW
jgi:hypothetical protein